MVRICIRMLRIPFDWFEFAFECFKSLSNGSNVHSNGSNPFRKIRICISNASNPFQIVRIWIRKLRIPFEWFEFAFECFESLSNGSNLHSNASNPFRMVQICIRMLRIMTMQYSCYIQQSLQPGLRNIVPFSCPDLTPVMHHATNHQIR